MISNGQSRLAAVGVEYLGITFKEDVADFRCTGVVSVLERLLEYAVDFDGPDSLCDPEAARARYEIRTGEPDDPSVYSAFVLAVSHTAVVDRVPAWVQEYPPRVLVDVKGAIAAETVPADVFYWRL